jgi:hypothetical protein
MIFLPDVRCLTFFKFSARKPFVVTSSPKPTQRTKKPFLGQSRVYVEVSGCAFIFSMYEEIIKAHPETSRVFPVARTMNS